MNLFLTFTFLRARHGGRTKQEVINATLVVFRKLQWKNDKDQKGLALREKRDCRHQTVFTQAAIGKTFIMFFVYFRLACAYNK